MATLMGIIFAIFIFLCGVAVGVAYTNDLQKFWESVAEKLGL